MPTTPNSKLPYPASTDPADVPTDMQKLAAALDVIAYTEIGAQIPVTATTEATANTLVASPSITYDGATPVMIEFFSPRFHLGAGVGFYMFLTLWDGSTDLGVLGWITNPAAGVFEAPVHVARRLTPAAGAHVYSVRASRDAGSGSGYFVDGGVGGAGGFVFLPMYLRIGRAT